MKNNRVNVYIISDSKYAGEEIIEGLMAQFSSFMELTDSLFGMGFKTIKNDKGDMVEFIPIQSEQSHKVLKEYFNLLVENYMVSHEKFLKGFGLNKEFFQEKAIFVNCCFPFVEDTALFEETLEYYRQEAAPFMALNLEEISIEPWHINSFVPVWKPGFLAKAKYHTAACEHAFSRFATKIVTEVNACEDDVSSPRAALGVILDVASVLLAVEKE